jgi:hypothetical protein
MDFVTDAPEHEAFSEAAPVLDSGSQRPTYWLTRFVLLRFLGFVYFIAFLVAANQLVPLVGHHGITPADKFLAYISNHFGSAWAAFMQTPTIFLYNASDSWIQGVSWLGVVLSLVVLAGYANSILMLILWALYLSIIHVGQTWYGYGWETQLVETGFLAVFLCPLLDGRPFSRSPPPVVIIWLYRWLIFRIMLGAGLIKLRGDEVWRDLTALYYHYETQPVPNPLSRLLHFAPQWFHKSGVAWNHFIELVVPFFIFQSRIPQWEKSRPGLNTVLQWTRHAAGFLMLSFQVILIFTGNLSFLNWLTIIPCLACFDDSFWQHIIPNFLVHRAESARDNAKSPLPALIASCIFACVVMWLSIAPVQNLFSSSQMMNTSFDRLHLVNTYGAFGTVGRERMEVIFEGTDDVIPNDVAEWREYGFKVKPGDPERTPPVITPYHYRLDWQAWFLPLEPGARHPWVASFIWRLLHNDKGTLSLLASNPFPAKPPRYIRAVLYHYKYTPLGTSGSNWWQRESKGVYIRPLSADDKNLRDMVSGFAWLD